MSIFSSKRMKRFIRIVAAYLLLLFVLTLGVNAAYEALGLGLNDETIKFSSMPKTIRICNFGSSHGRFGFSYEDLPGCPSFNFGLVSQSLSYDLRLMEYYQDHLGEGAVVFIPVSYFSLYGPSETEAEGFANKNARYYSILPASAIKEYDPKTARLSRIPVLANGPDTVKNVIRAIQERWDGRMDGNGIYWETTTDAADARADAVLAAERHLLGGQLNEEGERILNQEELDSLYKMIALCRKRGATPILVTTPFLSEYNEEVGRIAPDFFEDFHALLAQVQRDTGVEYHDYSADSRFCGEYSLFMNSDHLNRAGARRFTGILLDEVLGGRFELSSARFSS